MHKHGWTAPLDCDHDTAGKSKHCHLLWQRNNMTYTLYRIQPGEQQVKDKERRLALRPYRRENLEAKIAEKKAEM